MWIIYHREADVGNIIKKQLIHMLSLTRKYIFYMFANLHLIN